MLFGYTLSLFLSFSLFSVPPKQMYIKNSDNQKVYAIAGPYLEDSPMSLTCVAENGESLFWLLLN